MSSIAMGHFGAIHSLPEHSCSDGSGFHTTAPGLYVLNTAQDLSEHLASISIPSLVVWGDKDQTLAPAPFDKLVNQITRAAGNHPRRARSSSIESD